MDTGTTVVLAVVVLGLIFEFVNGFHDAANAIATVVATRVLTPLQALLMAGSLNLAGALAGTAVAATVAKGIVDSTKVTQDLVLAALVAAISWDLITFYAALPTSSSHALIFGMIGAAVSVHGWDVIIVPGVQKTSAAIVVSPTTALIVAYLLMLGLYWLLRNASASSVNRFFGKAQILSSAWMAFTHGGNDGQKTMGVISLALFAGGMLGGQPAGFVPNWVKFACAIAIALGTATGGYRIIKTMGMRITLLKPVNGFVAETTAGAVIEIATRLGIPISTTHAISGAILGVGATRRLSAVRWGIAGRIVSAWVLTIPGCFIMGWLAATLMRAAGLHV
ncbi:MAG TPA: anion permease [Chloroflexi bacterium]|jgi:PiT family inorganic phosphate transporter|nr:anion permease [Chloroflexota bacterium]HAL25332.1 anion permease [Chloroflexota bacterium]